MLAALRHMHSNQKNYIHYQSSGNISEGSDGLQNACEQIKKVANLGFKAEKCQGACHTMGLVDPGKISAGEEEGQNRN